MDTAFFRRDMMNEAKSYIDNQLLMNHYAKGGDENGPLSLNMASLHNDLDRSTYNPDGYLYFVNGHSRYGSIEKVGP